MREHRRWAGREWGTHLRETAAEAGGPAALGAGGPAAQALAAQDPVTALRVGAPRQVGAAFHVASQKGLLILWAEASADAVNAGRIALSRRLRRPGHQDRKPACPLGGEGGSAGVGEVGGWGVCVP